MADLNGIALDASDRILIFAPHPDDESIATGGIIQKAVALGLPIHVVWLTYGDNAETAFIAYRKRPTLRSKEVQGMGLVRHDEAVAAAGVLGLRPDQLTFLGYPDFRTLVIWSQHWGDAEPCESMFTRTRVVPYPNAYRPGAPYRADEILADIKTMLREFKPTKVFVSHPGDHNPDHLALYLFVRVALWDLAGEMQPALHPFLVHHPEWPAPEAYHPELPMTPPERLAGPGWAASPLTLAEIERKRQAMLQHQTQMRFGRTYLDSFMRSNELFGDVPVIRLDAGGGGEQVFAAGEGRESVMSSMLTHAERAKFVGIAQRGVQLKGGILSASFDFSRPLASTVSASVYVFGYRSDVPFSRMPKLQIKLTDAGQTVFDQDRRLKSPPIQVVRGAKGFSVGLPVALLGNPQWVLANARTYMSKMPLDWVVWRTIRLA